MSCETELVGIGSTRESLQSLRYYLRYYKNEINGFKFCPYSIGYYCIACLILGRAVMALAPLPFLKCTLVPRLLSRIKINNMKKIENVGKVHTQTAHPLYIVETIMETGFPLIMADIVAKQYKITSITRIEVDSVQGF